MEERAETFTERFNRLTKHMTDGQLMDILDLTATPLAKIRSGDTKTLKLRAGLRLARALGISAWYLIGEADPTRSLNESVPPTLTGDFGDDYENRIEIFASFADTYSDLKKSVALATMRSALESIDANVRFDRPDLRSKQPDPNVDETAIPAPIAQALDALESRLIDQMTKMLRTALDADARHVDAPQAPEAKPRKRASGE